MREKARVTVILVSQSASLAMCSTNLMAVLHISTKRFATLPSAVLKSNVGKYILYKILNNLLGNYFPIN